MPFVFSMVGALLLLGMLYCVACDTATSLVFLMLLWGGSLGLHADAVATFLLLPTLLLRPTFLLLVCPY
jgi:hypothetical protein